MTSYRQQHLDLALTCTESPWKGSRFRCAWCNMILTAGERNTGWHVECEQMFIRNHRHANGRKFLRTFQDKCQRCGKKDSNLICGHIIPARGAHGDLSCIHHLSNLEMLCQDCEDKTTLEQALSGLLGDSVRGYWVTVALEGHKARTTAAAQRRAVAAAEKAAKTVEHEKHPHSEPPDILVRRLSENPPGALPTGLRMNHDLMTDAQRAVAHVFPDL